MFHSATLKLTAWYMAIIIVISLLFSVVIYNVASQQIGAHFTQMPPFDGGGFLTRPTRDAFSLYRHNELDATRHSLMFALVVANLVIWVLGGIASHYTARRMLQPIEEAMDAQARFTSDASHELRTPLASMKTELEVALRDQDLTKDEMREQLASNLEEVNKLTALSHNLLKLSRLEHDEIIKEPVDLRDALQAVVSRFGADAARLSLPSHFSQPIVLANQASVEELLTIFIDNALKYSPADSPVRIDYLHTKTMSGFSFTNSGKGMAPEVLEHVFERFYQADPSRTSSTTRGYGLGLSLAKKLVELHGGELSATSVVNGETTFRFTLRNASKK